jgi:hypothetical protein
MFQTGKFMKFQYTNTDLNKYLLRVRVKVTYTGI